MKSIKIISLILLNGFFFYKSQAQYIVIDDTQSAQQLIQNTLINSSCASVSNFMVNGGNFGNSDQSFGFFDGIAAGFPFANGVVLSTCRAKSAPGPNNSVLSEDAPNWAGDLDLEQALGISNTSNATILEFDFVPLVNQISFDYIFASEEYHGTATCRYSDGFAFLLKKANTNEVYRNLALVPNTSIPVKVTNVHPDIPGACSAENASFFGSFNAVNSPTNFNGQTVVMTAKGVVEPGIMYHIKLVIADEQNPEYDSAIFLGGGSFKAGANLGNDKLIVSKNPVCNDEIYTLDATQPGINTYKWFKNGILINGVSTANLDVFDAGFYKSEIALGGSSCVAKSEVKIEFTPAFITTPISLVSCDDDNDSMTFFDLRKIENQILAQDSNVISIRFFENKTDINAISSPNNFNTIAPKTIFAKIKNEYNCENFVAINLSISNQNIATQNPIIICDDDAIQDGFFKFDLNANSMITAQILQNLPTGLIVKYYASSTAALMETNSLSSIFNNSIPYQQTIWAKILNGSDCFGIVPILLIVNTFSPSNFGDEILYLCENSTQKLEVAQGFSSYLWDDSSHSITNFINVGTAGNFSVSITDQNGCKATKKFVIEKSSQAIIKNVDIQGFQGLSNTVLINYTGFGDYEFSIDGLHFQNSPLFNGVKEGIYKIIVKDKNGCDPTSENILVLDYPRFFSPNNDGVNDVWRIPFLELVPTAKVSVFDRFGKMLYNTLANGEGWNGKFNNATLPSDDYWFLIELSETRKVQGHFSLIR